MIQIVGNISSATAAMQWRFFLVRVYFTFFQLTISNFMPFVHVPNRICMSEKSERTSFPSSPLLQMGVMRVNKFTKRENVNE